MHFSSTVGRELCNSLAACCSRGDDSLMLGLLKYCFDMLMLRACAKCKVVEIDGEVVVHDVNHSLADRMSLRKRPTTAASAHCDWGGVAHESLDTPLSQLRTTAQSHDVRYPCRGPNH